MAEVFQNVMQFKPVSAATLEVACGPVAASTTYKIASLTICNKSDTSDVVDLTHAVAGAIDADKQYIFTQLPLGPRETVSIEKLIILNATDVLRFKSQTGSSVINAWGSVAT